MANEQNLRPLNTRTKSEQRTIQVAGGVASGKARRDKKTAKEIVKAFFDEEVVMPDGTKLTRKQLMLMNALKRINNSIMLSNKNTALTNEELKCVDYALQMVGEAPIPKQINETTISTPIQIIDDVDREFVDKDTKPEGTD